MDKIGIIAEFNPFHKGHIYLINKVKKMFPNSIIVVIITTNFTERGDFSLLTKWEKTKIALNNKIDLVIEMPFYFATQSADTFAKYGVSVLEYLELDYLIFGSETNDLEVFKNIASTILYNTKYNNLVKEYLNLGNSYPSAMSKAIYNLTNIKLTKSNDLLAVSYIKTILENDFNIKPISIKRTNNYLDKNATNDIASATSIRELYFNNKDIKRYVPLDTLKYLNINNYLESYFNILKYKLITEIDNLDKYLDVNEGIDKKIKKNILKVNSYNELIESLKSKRWTYNKLNRMFLHILLNIQKNDKYSINYIRVLGFNKLGRQYLKKIKNDISIPIITNYKDIGDQVLYLEKIATIIYLNIINKNNLIKEELMSIPIRKD